MIKNLLPLIIAFVISVLAYPYAIPIIKKLKVGQNIRDNGPETHKKKSGTPTMGGIVIVLIFTVVGIFFSLKSEKGLVIILTTFVYGLIGFADDYLKVAKGNTKGLLPWQKLLAQFIVLLGFILYFYLRSGVGTKVLVPFTGGFENGVYLDLGYFFIPVFLLVFLGTVNGANLTDGLDGLCGQVTIALSTFFLVITILDNSGISPVVSTMIGALLGFVCYNSHPAALFMGDTGALAIGGFVASTAFLTKTPFYLAIVAFIYLSEVMSDIIQIGYYKKTHKRIFKMAPIHHHFEKCGYEEVKITTNFTIVTIIMVVAAIIGFTWR